MKTIWMGVLFFLQLSPAANAQAIGTWVPAEIPRSGEYLFYLHGGVVTVLGDNAINQSVPEWGPYEYSKILDSLRKRGFNVISEIRREGINDSVYVDKIVKQIDTLMQAGVKPKNLIVVGASAGWNITVHVSARLQNKRMKYVIMGGCWPETYKDYQDVELVGKFLSIIEASDPHGTCYRIFEGRKRVTSYKEVSLTTGLSHGFIYKAYKQWLDPMVSWFEAN